MGLKQIRNKILSGNWGLRQYARIRAKQVCDTCEMQFFERRICEELDRLRGIAKKTIQVPVYSFLSKASWALPRTIESQNVRP